MKILFLLFASSLLFAQTDPYLRPYVEARLNGVPAGSTGSSLFAPDRIAEKVVAQMPATRGIARDFAVRRSDLQAGAGPNSGGSTSLVVRAGLPEWFSAAVENGAFTRAQEGTVTTVRVGAIGLRRLFLNEDCAIGTECYDRFWGKGLSLYSSYDPGSKQDVVPLQTSLGGQTGNGFLGVINPRGRISAAGLKWEILHSLNVSGTKKSIQDWRTAVATLKDIGTELAKAIAAATEEAGSEKFAKRYREAASPGLKELFDSPDAKELSF